jgi:hypothetical protein
MGMGEIAERLEELGERGDLAGAPEAIAELEIEFAQAQTQFEEYLRAAAA